MSDRIFYILQVLNIYYNETEYLNLVIDKTDSNFYYGGDEDDISYEQEILESRKRSLLVYKKPILIYDNSNFCKLLCEQKYKALVEKFITECGKNWDDITIIIKVEKRIEINQLTYINNRFQIKNKTAQAPIV
jgi:hypothetical protein